MTPWIKEWFVCVGAKWRDGHDKQMNSEVDTEHISFTAGYNICVDL